MIYIWLADADQALATIEPGNRLTPTGNLPKSSNSLTVRTPHKPLAIDWLDLLIYFCHFKAPVH